MSNFTKAMTACARTWNGALSYACPDPSGEINGRASLFFKGCRGLNTPRLYKYLRECARESLLDTFLLAFHLRDCRGGKGERELGRQAFTWLFVNYPSEFRKVMHLIPDYGRWDDLLLFFPNVLKLNTLPQVRNDYSSNLQNEDYLYNLHALQSEVVGLVAAQLRTDLQMMDEGEPISLCAKWTPTEGDSLDKRHGIFKTLAKALSVSPKKLRREFNTPLREYLRIVEKYLCSRRWNEIDYSKVPSQCMRRLKKSFQNHDEERFLKWRESLQKGEVKVNAGALHPHNLITEIMNKNTVDPVTEAQWNVIEEKVKSSASLGDSVAVIDTSGSMIGIPLSVAVAMGLLISSSVQGPFHGHLISFNNVPKFTVVKDGDLYSRFQTVKNMDWGGSTNLESTFKLILQRGLECKLTDEDMPKRLFIISDMQFNCVEGHGSYGSIHTTNMENINRLYKDSGYTRPQIVFWNVNGSSTDFPVTVDENNTVLISGFSPTILNSLIERDKFTTETILRKALDDERYNPVREALGEDYEMVN